MADPLSVRDRKKARERRYHEANRDRILQRRRARYSSATQRRHHLKHKYGITPEEQGILFASQNFKCATCGSYDPKRKTGWHVDHCHATKKVRGVLCHGCNTALGLVRDDPTVLRALAEY